MPGHVLVLSGSLGLGHAMMARSCREVFDAAGWSTTTVDAMGLLGGHAGRVGERVFHHLVERSGIYDSVHFAHLRTGSGLALRLDRLAAQRLVPALQEQVRRQPPDLVLSVFATGASAAARLRPSLAGAPSVVLCTDAVAHRLWVWEGTDLFLVTSAVAAASVRRFLPRAVVAIVPPPVRPAFYDLPSQPEARHQLGLGPGPCVLLIDSGWGLGAFVASAEALAASGVQVLAVAGRNSALEARLRALALEVPLVRAFGFTEDVPLLMAACDVVVALPGATTCAEARVARRPLLLLDVMPGHGRDNVQHELELGNADVVDPLPASVRDSALAVLDRCCSVPPDLAEPAPPDRFGRAFVDALALVGVHVAPTPVPCTLEGPPS